MSTTPRESVKVWLDDIRPAPHGWVWVRTNAEARDVLTHRGAEITEISLDHDLGLDMFSEEQIDENPELLFGRGDSPDGDGLDLVRWMCAEELVPPKVTIHSWNATRAKAMADTLNDHGFDCIIREFDPADWR